MDNKKFEQLIDLIINENEEQAKALFHDIVVEKSREIYESMMDEELDEAKEEDDEEEAIEESKEEDEEEELDEGFDGMDEGHDEVGGLLDEIDAEEQGMTEEEDEFADIEMDGEEGDEQPEGDLEDRVVDLEDKLDELMAEFEEMMAGEEGEEHMGGEEDLGGEEGGEEFGAGEEEEQGMMEAVQLQKVSVTHGDNGQNTKSTVSGGPKVGGNGAKAIHITDGNTSGGTVKAPQTIPGSYKNAPGAKFSEKGEAAPKAKAGDNGQNTKSITSESKKTTKKIVK